jgi:isocitrate dehydrogenase (NAD+)
MTSTSQKRIPATLIPGDGIGPEVTEATLAVLEAVGAPFEWETMQAGMAGVAACGDPLPAETLTSIRKTRLALKGPLATPVGGSLSSNVRLREIPALCQPAPGAHARPGALKIDLVLVRKTSGLYVGFEHYIHRRRPMPWRSPRGSTRAQAAGASTSSRSTTR